MSVIKTYIAEANAKCRRGGRTPFQIFDMLKEARSKRLTDGCVSFTTDSIGSCWGFWDIASTLSKHDEICVEFAWPRLHFYETVFPHVTDGCYTMIPVADFDVILERIDLFLEEFERRLEADNDRRNKAQ